LHADAAHFVAWADAHLFERRSVVYERELLSAALAHGRGQNVTVSDLRKAVEARYHARQIGTDKLTSQEALQCELDIVLTAEKGRSRHLPFNPRYDGASALSEEQRAAVKQILNSHDFITLFRGRAGTGIRLSRAREKGPYGRRIIILPLLGCYCLGCRLLLSFGSLGVVLATALRT